MLSIMFTWDGKTLYMEDIYVRSAHRSKGIGKLLFNRVKRYARETKCNRIHFEVVKWNPARAFYEKMKAENVTETIGYHTYVVKKHVIDECENNGNH